MLTQLGQAFTIIIILFFYNKINVPNTPMTPKIAKTKIAFLGISPLFSNVYFC